MIAAGEDLSQSPPPLAQRRCRRRGTETPATTDRIGERERQRRIVWGRRGSLFVSRMI